MKKKYQTPEIEVVTIETNQLLNSSNTDLELYDVLENEEQI